ncbi:MAG: hypothetical protein MI784_09680 [Cytophagales bacterium]|nr:hypothetical protein [Cytophagales bacterium]
MPVDPDEEPLSLKIDDVGFGMFKQKAKGGVSKADAAKSKKEYRFTISRKSTEETVTGSVDVYAFDDDTNNQYFKRVNLNDLNYALSGQNPHFVFTLGIDEQFDRIAAILYGSIEGKENSFDYMCEKTLCEKETLEKEKLAEA